MSNSAYLVNLTLSVQMIPFDTFWQFSCQLKFLPKNMTQGIIGYQIFN